MCGISGVYSFKGRSIRFDVLCKINQLLSHRGPDGEGYFLLNTRLNKSAIRYNSTDISDIGGLEPNLGLAHRRLSIIDLSVNARQPMSNDDASIWIVFNGEIYNYIELMQELSSLGCHFKSSSDTEVILRSYEFFGRDCVKRFNGMWAFAIWDARRNIIFCSRDRFGVKPFYYYHNEGLFAFASEIKALLPLKRACPNERGIFNYLAKSFGFLDVTDETLFEDIYQLSPAHNLIIGTDGLKVEKYWDIYRAIDKPLVSQECAAEAFSSLFIDAVKIRLRSDVKLAGALSGGIDSSSITCVIKKCLNVNNYETYSACFDNPQYDEREYISEVTRDTGFKSNYVFPDESSFFDILKRQIWLQDEPFNAMWVHSQWFVYQKASSDGVKVFINGHGSDESLGGYYPHFYALWADLLRRGRIRRLLREIYLFSKHNPGRPVRLSNIMQYIINYYIPRSIKNLFPKMPNFLNPDFAERNVRNMYRYENSFNDLLNRYLYESLFISPIRGMLHFDDRNSMAFSMESRTPFLDYRIIELAFSLPGMYKIKDGYNKYLLRQAMRGIIPERIQERFTKKGFSSGAPQWLRRNKEYLHKLFNPADCLCGKYLKSTEVVKEVDRYCDGKTNMHERLGSWVTLELWFRKFISDNGGVETENIFYN